MEASLQKRHLLIFSVLTAASILIFQISVVFFLLAVPLFIIYRRYGIVYLTMSGFFVALVIVIQTIIRASGIEDSTLRRFLIFAELFYPLALIVGVIIVSWFNKKTLFLLLTATMVFALLSFPVFYHYSGNSEIIELLKNQIVSVSNMFRDSISSSDSFEANVLLKQMSPELVVKSTAKLVLRNYLFAYFIMLTFSWYIADLLVCKISKKKSLMLVNFAIPDIMIWPLIFFLGGVLLDIFVGIPWLGYFLWNGAFIIMFVYGLHGIGLVNFLLNKYKVTRRGRRFLSVFIFAVLLMPGINLVILLGVPVLGISELWITYRV